MPFAQIFLTVIALHRSQVEIVLAMRAIVDIVSFVEPYYFGVIETTILLDNIADPYILPVDNSPILLHDLNANKATLS